VKLNSKNPCDLIHLNRESDGGQNQNFNTHEKYLFYFVFAFIP